MTGSSSLLTGLLSCGPKSVGHLLGVDTATKRCGLSILCNLDGVQLGHVDLNTVVHLAQGSECTMVTIVSKNGNVVVRCKFDLEISVRSMIVELDGVDFIWDSRFWRHPAQSRAR